MTNPLPALSGASPPTPAPRLSALAYFAWVALVTAVGIGIAMLLRPAWAYSVRDFFGLEKRLEAKPGSFYTVRVAPLLEDHCTGCHGATRQKAQLRLDSFAAAMHGGKHGPVIKAASLRDSPLISRLELPSSNEKAMPPEGKPPLSADEVTVIKLWVAAGASGTQPVGAIKGAPKAVVQIKFPEINEAAVVSQRAAMAADVKRLQARFPNILAYESRGSADLEVNASLMGAAFGDAELTALAPLNDRIVRADFSGTSLSDASASSLAAMKHLRVLRLINTRVTDKTVEALAPLTALHSVAIAGKGVSEQSLRRLQSRGVTVYDGNGAQESLPGTAESSRGTH